MKSGTVVIIISICIGLVSCDQNQEENLYRANRIYNSYNTVVLPQNQIDSIKQLFRQNNLSYANLQFYRFQKDNLGYQHVRCSQFVNTLKVFTTDLIFHFDRTSKYYYLSGVLVDKIKLDTKQAMNCENVIAVFTDLLKLDNGLWNNADVTKKNYFEIEFGYYDLNVGESVAPYFTKVWKIHPLNSEYPYAYINDRTAAVIYYDNGIRDF